MDTNEYHDTQETIMLIKKATMLMDPFLKLAMTGQIKLLQFLARMVKEKFISKDTFKDFQDFVKKTEGDFELVNIPVDLQDDLKSAWIGEESIDKDIAELREKGVRLFVMPDLDNSDGYQQIAVSRKDMEIFSAWQEKYMRMHMKGGEKNIDSLYAFTKDEVSIISIPLEGKEEIFREDFQHMKINYAILPDLKVGDGQIQLLVAACDFDKVEKWYQMYQHDMLERGNKIPDLNVIDMDTYKKTGEMTEEEYINTADKNIKEANQKYEKGKEFTEKVALKEAEKTYEDYERDMRYQKFTIDAETLVENPKSNLYTEYFFKSLDQQDLFASRIPGTYGEKAEYLIVPKETVFETMSDSGKKTYTIFCKKDEQPLVADNNGLYAGTNRLYANQLYKKHYDLLEKEKNKTTVRQKTEKTLKQKEIKERSISKQPKTPKPPVKVK